MKEGIICTLFTSTSQISYSIRVQSVPVPTLKLYPCLGKWGTKVATKEGHDHAGSKVRYSTK